MRRHRPALFTFARPIEWDWGQSHDEHETKFAVQLGTGVNIPTGPRAHVRLGVDTRRQRRQHCRAPALSRARMTAGPAAPDL